jgi:hypothetical protein
VTEWYCDLTLGRASVRLIMDQHLEFNEFDIPLPIPPGESAGVNLLYVRISPDGTKFAGVGGRKPDGTDDDHCWVWSNGWQRLGIAFGPQSVIFDRDNVLRVLAGPPSVGYRYVTPSNAIVTCDATRKHPTLPIWDWTELDNGVIIGQGGDKIGHGDDPVVAHFEGVMRLLQDGRCHFINAYGSGEQACYACVREDTNQALTRWMTLQDIRNSPEITGSVTPDPIPLDQIEALSGELLVAWYEQKKPPTTLPPGNAEIAIGHPDEQGNPGYPPGTVRPRPVLAMMSNFANITPAFAVQLGSEGMHNDEGMLKMEALAAELHADGIRPFVYWDDRRTPRPFDLPPGSVFAFMAYCGRDEPLDAFRADVDAAIREHSQHYEHLIFACQTHTTNDSLIEEPSRAIPTYVELVKKYRQSAGGKLIGVSIFNNSGRDYPDGSKGGLTANPQLVPHWTKAFGACTFPAWLLEDGVADPITIEIGEYAKKVSRKDPKGFLLPFDITSAERIEKISLSMEGDGEPPIVFEFPPGPDGRYVRGMAFKPVRTGDWFPLVKVWDEDGQQATQRGPAKVKVTEEPVNGHPPPVDLGDQLPLVTQLRKDLFPDKFQPGHPQANPDGFLPLHDIEKAALWAKHLAWNLRGSGVGMVKAKPGSANHGGANSISPIGFTTDIVALATGEHWDFQIDGAEGAAYPTWSKDENPANQPPIAERWVPAFEPSTP